MVHALVAALAMEALLQIWHVKAPGDRLGLRMAGLLQPLLVTPALWLCACRQGEEFQDRWSLFASRRWEDLSVGGLSAFEVFLAVIGILGATLFLMDLVPLLLGRRRGLPPSSPAPEELLAQVEDVAAAMGARPPPLHFLEARAPVLFCHGVRLPGLVVSRGVIELLDGEELRAALSHELAHLRHRDPALSWLLMAVRACLFFNPAAQVVARAVARDAEWRADEGAGGDRLALASALVKLHRVGLAAPGRARRTLPFASALSEPMRRARSHDVLARCRRLLEPAALPETPLRNLRVALASAALAGLCFLIT
jgi:Zn-dependent protease with chaperone function